MELWEIPVVAPGQRTFPGTLLDLATTHNLVEKSGSWFSYKGERIGQGRENARLFLKEHADTRDRLEVDVRNLLGLPLNGLAGLTTSDRISAGSR